MRKIILSGILVLSIFNTSWVNAQTAFNFSCTRDTIISCTIPSITLKATIPELFGLADSYAVNPVSGAPNGCYNQVIPPETPGPSTNLNIDDLYSDILPIGFTFPFFGTNYTQLIASSNGYLSFDISKRLAFSHFAIPTDLVNGNIYDRAIIMGVYHDLTPEPQPNRLPDWQIKIETLGTAPYRKCILSFNHIPLWSSPLATCGVFNRNSSQIVLYESLGIVEIFIRDEQFCTSWQNGKAMVGMQDFTKTKFVMAPGRKASDPPWGTVGMNESWRFTPNTGPSLFKRVELFDLSNTLISTGITSPGATPGTLDVDFPNVTPTTSPATYIVKSAYQKIDDPAVEIYGIDTVTISRDNSLPVTASSLDPICNTGTGSITITDPIGPVYEYSIDGVNWQTSPVFNNLPPAIYTVRTRISGTFCGGNTDITLTAPPPIPIIATVANILCNSTSTGNITVTDPVGVDYEYSINGGTTWQSSPIFNNLAAANYTITINKISISCKSTQNFPVTQPPVLTAAASQSSPSSCANNDGSITVTSGGGTPAYEFSADNGITWQTSNILIGFPVGTVTSIRVRDANGCVTSPSTTITLNDTMRLELGTDSTICFGSSITIIPQTNALTDTFKWTPKATLNFDTLRTPIATPVDTTKYYLTAKWGVCTRKDSITINVLHKPVANAGADTTVCYKTNATLFGSASNLSGTVNFAWSPADSLTSPNTAVTGVRLDTTRQFTLTVTDNYGCNFSVTDSVKIIMQPQLVAFAGNDTTAIINRAHQLMATARNAVDFVWSPAAPLNSPFLANPVAILNRDTYFYVQVTDAIGCVDFDSIFIKVYEGPTYYLPNAFTPNGDSRNDIFFPVPVGIRSTDYFRIFNRFGTLMYETRQWMQGWDGTIKGKPAASGTYVWMIKGIDKNGSVVEMKGTVILLR